MESVYVSPGLLFLSLFLSLVTMREQLKGRERETPLMHPLSSSFSVCVETVPDLMPHSA